jgi:hypothetical protein
MLTALALAASILTSTQPPNLSTLESCSDSLDVAIFVSPRYPHPKTDMRVVVVSDSRLDGVRVVAQSNDGASMNVKTQALGGPPFGWVAKMKSPGTGKWRVALARGDTILACQKVTVSPTRRPARRYRRTGQDSVWRSRWKWERDTENFYSIWLEHLFAAPPDKDLTWKALHHVVRDTGRNLLHDHLNLGEDTVGQSAMFLKPDCADFPYFLRAYFAWKVGLPASYRHCSRGRANRPPGCGKLRTNHQLAEKRKPSRAFEYFARRNVAGGVHSSSGRTLPQNNQTDYYPVKMTRRSLRPGTIFADPYGHVLVISGWVPQKDGKPGILFAVDAQPDGTVGRRRFWKGSFLFPLDGGVKGAGFKRMRPVYRGGGDHWSLSNERIARSPDYGDFSTEQWDNGHDAFYERMDELINPIPMSPEQSLRSVLDALAEQVKRRVLSIKTGELWRQTHRGRVIPMPRGASIFQTSGPWEDYSTPSRDLRLLTAMQTVLDFPDRVRRHPKRFKLAPGVTPQAAAQRLRANLMTMASKQVFNYERSNGDVYTLTVRDVIERRKALEMAYNPNDCPEIRWAAPQMSEEFKSCNRRAPKWQTRRMKQYRPWFANRRRPVR